MPASHAPLPPRPWETGDRVGEPASDRDLGVERPWGRAGASSSSSAPPSSGTSGSGTAETRLTPLGERSHRGAEEPFALYDAIRRTARALQAIADRLDSDDADARRRGRVAAAANVFYALGVLSARGMFVPRALPGTPSSSGGAMLLGAGDACRALAEELDRLVARLADGVRPQPSELGQLADRLEECWDRITREGESREGAP